MALLSALAWGYTQGLRLDATRAKLTLQLTEEQAAHNATRHELSRAQQKITTLGVALVHAQNATAAVQGSLRMALAREADAASAAAARKQIISQMRRRIRTDAEKSEVVDDATRDAVADRLNRPL